MAADQSVWPEQGPNAMLMASKPHSAFMSKRCTACGVTPPKVEQEPPPKPTKPLLTDNEPEKCPNCGKEGTMEEVAELPTGEEEEE